MVGVWALFFSLGSGGCASRMPAENTVVDGLASRGNDAEELLAPPTPSELEVVRVACAHATSAHA